MKANPFQFIHSQQATDALLGALEKLGVSRDTVDAGYRTEVWSFIWRDSGVSAFQLRWVRAFWPDGVSEEDQRVSLHVGDGETGRVDIQVLLKSKMREKLRDEIARQIVALAATVPR